MSCRTHNLRISLSVYKARKGNIVVDEIDLKQDKNDGGGLFDHGGHYIGAF